MKISIKLSKLSAFLGILTVILLFLGNILQTILFSPIFFVLYSLPFLIPIYWILVGSKACFKEKKAIRPFYKRPPRNFDRDTLPSRHLIESGILVVMFSFFIHNLAYIAMIEEVNLFKFNLYSIIPNSSGFFSILGGIIYYLFDKKKNSKKNKLSSPNSSIKFINGKIISTVTIRMVNGRDYQEDDSKILENSLENQKEEIRINKIIENQRYKVYLSLSKMLKEKRKQEKEIK